MLNIITTKKKKEKYINEETR